MNSAPRARLDALTGLRYLAALSVLIAHMEPQLPPGGAHAATRALSAVLSARVGMTLFFTLSGFLMAYNYAAGFRTGYRKTLRTYAVARVARIYPVYLLGLLLYFSFVGNFFHDVRNRPDDTARCLLHVGTLTQSWVHAPVFAGDHNPRTVTLSYMSVAWSVSTEAFLYLSFPLLVLPLARFVTSRRRLLAGGGVVFATWLAADYLVVAAAPAGELSGPGFGYGWTRWLLYLSPYGQFGAFLIGAMAGQDFTREAARPADRHAQNWWAGAGLMGGSVAVMIAVGYWISTPGGSPAPAWVRLAAMNILFAPTCAVLVYQSAALPSLAARVLGCRPMVVLGEMSYCLYLLHPLAQSLYSPRSQGEGPMQDAVVVLFNNAAMVVVLHFLCLGVYRYFEVPARTAIRTLLDRRPAPVTVPAASGPCRASRAA